MVLRETRVVGTAVFSVLVVLGVFGVVETLVGFPAEWVNLVAFVLIAGLGFAAPQLYLARTDSDVAPAWRLRAVFLFVLLAGTTASSNATAAERVTIWTLVAGTLLGVLAYEFRAGCLASLRKKTTPLQ